MDFKIEKDNNKKQISVSVAVSKNTAQKESADTQAVLLYLKNNNIEVGECLRESHVNNRNGVFTGKWLFSSHKPKKTVDKPSPPMLSSKRVKKPKKLSVPSDE
tara:strand:+ start:173 stop:481 length:309 start_codon:yes stop_codon:yes gene_type:complete